MDKSEYFNGEVVAMAGASFTHTSIKENLSVSIGPQHRGTPCRSGSADIVPVHTIHFPPGLRGNYRPPTLKLYLQLEDAVGTFYVRAILREEGDGTKIFRADPVEVPFDELTDSRLIPIELGLELAGLYFPRPGVYEIIIYANYVSLHDPAGSRPYPPVRITVMPADGSTGGVL